MRKNKILILALLVCLSIPVRAQNTDNNIIGIVVDKWGNPVYGASVNVEGGAVETRVETDKDGKFEIASMIPSPFTSLYFMSPGIYPILYMDMDWALLLCRMRSVPG